MIFVNSCGHDSQHPRPCNIEHKTGLPDYLILLVKQEAWIILDGKKQIMHPNAMICFPPKTYIHYGCDKAGYNDDWIHFVPDEAELSLLSSLNIPMCRILYPYGFHRLSEYVRLLSDNFHGSSPRREQILDSFMHIILFSLPEEPEAVPGFSAARKYYRDFSDLRTQIYNNPASPRSIPQLADSLCLSLSRFQHLYRQFFHCSCQQDIINARLESARYYLVNSSMSIRQIADFCGYESDLHFMRQFKKFTGVTPTTYRRYADSQKSRSFFPADLHAASGDAHLP